MKGKDLFDKVLGFVCIAVLAVGIAQIHIPKDFHSLTKEQLQDESPTVIVTVPDTFDESNKLIWDRIEKDITNAPTKVIIINWMGYGGYVYMMDQLADVIDSAEAHGHIVILNLIGPSYSCHANIICHASIVIWNGNFAGYHSVFTVDANGNKIFSDDTSPMTICLAKGILTLDDLHTMIHDRMMILVYQFHTETTPDQKHI